MAELRKIAISNTNNKSKGNTPLASGATTPTSMAPLLNDMDRTDSMINLTKPELYSYYQNDSFVNMENDLTDSTSDLEFKVSRRLPNEVDGNGRSVSNNFIATSNANDAFQFPFIVKLIILSSSAYLYNEITRHINYDHFNDKQLASFPLTITHVFLYSFVSKFKLGNYIENIDTSELGRALDGIFALTLQGLLMASLHPIFDRLLPKIFTKRLLSSNPIQSAPSTSSTLSTSSTSSSTSLSNTNFMNDLIRTCITFLGISYAIRKIEWSSFLQVSIIWSLINPGLWLLLDGTISGFLSSLLVTALCCIIIYLQNTHIITSYSKTTNDVIALWLWIGSFFFCGIIIFGKIGRGLFGSGDSPRTRKVSRHR